MVNSVVNFKVNLLHARVNLRVNLRVDFLRARVNLRVDFLHYVFMHIYDIKTHKNSPV